MLERIAPLEVEHAKLKQSLIQAENSLTSLSKGLSNVDSNVANLRTVFEKRTSEAANLKMELDKTRETLLSAETLVGELESEHTRWENQVNVIQSEILLLNILQLVLIIQMNQS